jgi:tetratricopeptide (TPR) repeat protein
MMPTLKTALVATLFCLSCAALADELGAAQRLWLAGQRDAAVALTEAALKKTPDDLKLRFSLGVMRMDLGQREPARAIFTSLTQDFPDLADPYNNLAVLHASAGELDQAQAALEQALRLQPDNIQALENLGDVLLRLAARAYERAGRASLTPHPQLATKLNRTLALARELRPAR